MWDVVIAAIVTFFVTNLLGYIIHRFLHQTWAGSFYHKHMTHHLILYPTYDYTSVKYRNAGKDNTVITFLLISIPLVILMIFLWLLNILSLAVVVTILLTIAILGFLHNFIHDAFHIEDHILNKIPIIKNLFEKWNRIHYLHHYNLEKNYGIFFFAFDRLFGTLLKD